MRSRIAVMENVVNPTNVGAIFRSAAALHMDGVLAHRWLLRSPYTAGPARVSMGTVFQIPWTYFHKKMEWPKDGMKLLEKTWI